MKTLHLPRCHWENFIFSLKDNVVVVCDFVLFFCWFWFFFFSLPSRLNATIRAPLGAASVRGAGAGGTELGGDEGQTHESARVRGHA